MSNVSFSLSNNETYLSIFLHSRRKIILYGQWLLLARMNYATRLRLVTHHYSLIYYWIFKTKNINIKILN
jgi:hypothetical protein